MANTPFHYFVAAQVNLYHGSGTQVDEQKMVCERFFEWGEVVAFLSRPFANAHGLTDDSIAHMLNEFSLYSALYVDFSSPAMSGVVIKVPQGAPCTSIQLANKRERS